MFWQLKSALIIAMFSMLAFYDSYDRLLYSQSFVCNCLMALLRNYTTVNKLKQYTQTELYASVGVLFILVAPRT